MIEAITGARPLMISNLMRVQQSQRKMSVPVKPYVTRYASFKHIIGVPSGEDAGSIPVSKLIMLDNLIEKISGKSGQAETFLKISQQNIDQLISNLKSEYHYKLNAAPGPSAGPGLHSGILLDTFA